MARDNLRAATKQLRAFMNEINGLIRSGRLSLSGGEDLTDAAQLSVDQLN